MDTITDNLQFLKDEPTLSKIKKLSKLIFIDKDEFLDFFDTTLMKDKNELAQFKKFTSFFFKEKRNYNLLENLISNLDEHSQLEANKQLSKHKINGTVNLILVPLMAAFAIDTNSEDKLFEDIAALTLVGNAHSFILDDVVDNKYADDIHNKMHSLLISQLFYHHFLTEMYKICDFDEWYINRMKIYYDEMYESLLWEDIKHVDNIQEYSNACIEKNSYKCSPVKALFLPMIKNAKNLDKNKTVEITDRLVTLITTGSLIFDDFYDWEEDIKRSRYTMPLALAMKKMGRTEPYLNPESLDESELNKIQKALYFSDAPLNVFKIYFDTITEAEEITKENFPTVSLLVRTWRRYMETKVKEFIKIQMTTSN
jgi:hypothetical protein